MTAFNADPQPDTQRIRQTSHTYRLAPFAALKVDQYPAPGGTKVYSLTVKIGTHRLKLLVDPNSIPAPP